eukprot:2590776-Pyramimonas_sp.AAC.1
MGGGPTSSRACSSRPLVLAVVPSEGTCGQAWHLPGTTRRLLLGIIAPLAGSLVGHPARCPERLAGVVKRGDPCNPQLRLARARMSMSG